MEPANYTSFSEIPEPHHSPAFTPIRSPVAAVMSPSKIAIPAEAAYTGVSQGGPKGNVLIVSIGTRGDVEPYLVFGSALQHAGYAVALATHTPYESFVRASGLTFFELLGDPQATVTTDRFKSAFYKGGIREQVQVMMDSDAVVCQEQNYARTWEATQLFKANCLIGTITTIPECIAIGQRLHIPVIIASTVPFLPSKDVAPVTIFAESMRFGLLNEIFGSITHKAMWLAVSAKIKKFRKEKLGMPEGDSNLPVPFFNIYSKHVAPPPEDWPASAYTVGYWASNHPGPFEPPQDLVDFLAAGPPPVYIGFGSMPLLDGRLLASQVVEAMQSTGLRALLACGASDFADFQPPSWVFLLRNSVPHAWLFPRCSMAIHHGGAGTTAASMRAGIPTVIFPLLSDQPFWAQRAAALGVGPLVIVPLKFFNANTLESQISAVNTPTVRAAATALGEKLRSEDGVAYGLAVFERLFTACKNRHGLTVRWEEDVDAPECRACTVKFNFLTRRHHCRACGRVFCKHCLLQRPLQLYASAQLVCKTCNKALSAAEQQAQAEVARLPALQ